MRIIGSPRFFENKRVLHIYDIVVSRDGNELTHHLLDIVLTHLQNTKGPLNQPVAAVSKQPMTPGGISHAFRYFILSDLI